MINLTIGCCSCSHRPRFVRNFAVIATRSFAVIATRAFAVIAIRVSALLVLRAAAAAAAGTAITGPIDNPVTFVTIFANDKKYNCPSHTTGD